MRLCSRPQLGVLTTESHYVLMETLPLNPFTAGFPDKAWDTLIDELDCLVMHSSYRMYKLWRSGAGDPYLKKRRKSLSSTGTKTLPGSVTCTTEQLERHKDPVFSPASAPPPYTYICRDSGVCASTTHRRLPSLTSFH